MGQKSQRKFVRQLILLVGLAGCVLLVAWLLGAMTRTDQTDYLILRIMGALGIGALVLIVVSVWGRRKKS